MSYALLQRAVSDRSVPGEVCGQSGQQPDILRGVAKGTIMNKLVKGSIAGAAGIALLLGGAGTLALWNASADIADVSISSGTLNIAATGGTWTGSSMIIPGKTATYTDTLTINATGDNLAAQLSIDPASITGDAALKGALVTKLVATGTGVTQVGTSNVYTVTPAAGAITVNVTVTVTLPAEVTGVTAQGESVNLNGLSFLLKQV
jgi:alternate signal-mediated exported protein